MVIGARCLEATFCLAWEEEAERIERLEMFKYLGRLLDRSYEDHQAVLRNLRKARQVWGRVWRLLQREGSEQAVSEKFYRAIVQVVVVWGGDVGVISANGAEVRGSACGFPATGNKVKGKSA